MERIVHPLSDDLCPGYLPHGLKEYAARNLRKLSGGADLASPAANAFVRRWARRRFPSEFKSFFRDVTAMIEGRGSG